MIMTANTKTDAPKTTAAGFRGLVTRRKNRNCQCDEPAAATIPCPLPLCLDQARVCSTICLDRHLGVRHPGSDAHLESMTRRALKAIEQGWMSSARMGDIDVTPGGIFLAGSRCLFALDTERNTERELPVILRVIPRRTEQEDPGTRRLNQQVSEFLWTSNLEAAHVTWSQTNIQVLATLPHEIPATAGGMPESLQKETSAGLYINPDENIHQINKRMKLISGDGEGLISHPEASRLFEFNHEGRDHGTLHVNPSLPLRTMILDTGESDDGSMAIRGMPWEIGTPGQQLAHALGLRKAHRCNYSMANIGFDDSFAKGLIKHVPDRNWHHPSADLVMDAECVKHQIHTGRTMLRIMPKRMNHGECVTMATHLQVMPILERYVEERTLLEYQEEAFQHLLDRSRKLVQDLHEKPMETGLAELMENEPAPTGWLKELLDSAGDPPARDMTPFDQRRAILRENVGHNPYADPAMMRATSGRKGLTANLSKIRKNFPEAGVLIFGMKGYFRGSGAVDGHPAPKPGWISADFAPNRPDAMGEPGTILSFYLNPEDIPEFKEFSGGCDCDDLHLMVLLQNPGNHWYRLLIIRTPATPGDGMVYRIEAEQARKLMELGLRPYPMRTPAEPRFGPLDRRTGKKEAYQRIPVTPVEAPPHPSNLAEALDTGAKFVQPQGLIGALTNLLSHQLHSGNFDPEVSLADISDVIDSLAKGTGDPEPLYQQLLEQAYLQVIRGDLQDNCTWGRVSNAFQEMHENWGAFGQEKLERIAVIGCSEAHAKRQRLALDTQKRIESHLRKLQLSSGIQPETIARPRDPRVDRIAVAAHLAIKNAWQERYRQERQIRQTPTSPAEKARMRQEAGQTASNQEQAAIERAERQARELPDYRTGDLAHALTVAEATWNDRFHVERATPFGAVLDEQGSLPTKELHREWERRNWRVQMRPLRTAMLGWLSSEEQTAHARAARFAPAAVVRVIRNHEQVTPGRRYTVARLGDGAVLKPGKQGRRQSPIHLGPEALDWVGRKVRAVGLIPGVSRPSGTSQMWTERALVLEFEE